jgi:hypothetical protein
MGDDKQRPCARGERCAEATSVRGDGGKTVKEPALGYRSMCETDRAQVLRSLEQFPGYYARLGAAIGDKLAVEGERVSGSRTERPIPINTTVEAAMVDLVLIVASWTERVDEVAGLSGDAVAATRKGYARPGTVGAMCAILTAHVDALLALPAVPMTRYVPLRQAAEYAVQGVAGTVHVGAEYAEVAPFLDGGDAGVELLKLNTRCRNLLGLNSRDVEVPTACFGCDLKGVLYRPDGAAGLLDMVRCRNCGRVYEGGDFTRLMAHVEGEQLKRERKEAS